MKHGLLLLKGKISVIRPAKSVKRKRLLEPSPSNIPHEIISHYTLLNMEKNQNAGTENLF